MEKFKALVASTVAVAILFGAPIASLAQTSTSTTSSSTIQAQLDVITQLLKQIEAIKSQIASLQQQQTQLVQQTQQNVTQLVTMLREGSVGDNVKILQALLAADPTIYPEGKITGFFGKLTASAVRRYQKKHRLEQVGNVGPKTLHKLNEDLKENQVSLEDSGDRAEGKRPCAIVPPGHLIAPGWLKKHNEERPTVPECQTLPPGIARKLGHGTSTPTTTDTVAPVISSLAATNVTTSGAVITWTTNEAANSKVYFGTATPLNLASLIPVTNNSMVTSHSVALSGLVASTTYYFAVTSADAAGNIATSSQSSFTTSVLADTTAPVISAATSSSVASSSATVSWTTNKPATSKVYYGTTSPLNLGTAASVSDATLFTSHSLGLTGLTASSTYHFIVQSSDASNNTATSSEMSFTTTQ